MKITVTLEGAGPPTVHDVEPEVTIAELTKTVSPEDDDLDVYSLDVDRPLSAELTLAEAELDDGAEISILRSRTVAVAVRYAGQEKKDSRPPQQRTGRVFRWALGKQGLDLPRDQWTKFELAAAGAQDPVDPEAPIAAYVDRASRTARFDLRPTRNYQGSS